MAELTEKNISNENDGKGLEALKNLQNEQENKDVVQEEITKKEPVIDNLGRSYATGRRKSSIACSVLDHVPKAENSVEPDVPVEKEARTDDIVLALPSSS